MNDENNTPIINTTDVQMSSTPHDDDKTTDETPVATKEFDISADLDIKPVTNTVLPPPETKEDQKPFVSTLNVLNSVKVPEAKPAPVEQKPIEQNQKWGDLQSTVSGMIPEKYKSTPKAEAKQVEAAPVPVVQNPNLKPLRTYEGDIAEALAHKRTSVATIAIAESKKRDGQDAISNNTNTENTHSGVGKKILLILLSLILIGAGVIGAYYLYTKSPLATTTKTPVTTQPIVIKSIIPSDSQVNISIDNLNPEQIKQKVLNEINNSKTPNTIKEIILTKNKDNQKTKPATNQMTDLMKITAPSILVKSLLSDWMLGTYTDELGNTDTFVVVMSDFFQDSFAGMLQWENVMADDLKSYITTSPIKNIVNGPPLPSTTATISKPATKTSTKITTTNKTTKKSAPVSVSTSTEISTSTPTEEPVIPYQTIRGQFNDRIIRSRDARVFKTSDGKTLFVYSFIDNKHLIFTGKENTLSGIISRLEKQAFVR